MWPLRLSKLPARSKGTLESESSSRQVVQARSNNPSRVSISVFSVYVCGEPSRLRRSASVASHVFYDRALKSTPDNACEIVSSISALSDIDLLLFLVEHACGLVTLGKVGAGGKNMSAFLIVWSMQACLHQRAKSK